MTQFRLANKLSEFTAVAETDLALNSLGARQEYCNTDSSKTGSDQQIICVSEQT